MMIFDIPQTNSIEKMVTPETIGKSFIPKIFEHSSYSSQLLSNIRETDFWGIMELNCSAKKISIYDYENKNENEEYIITDDYERKFNELTAIFGGMTYLSEEGQEAYNSILDDIFEGTGINLFDLL
ncbi:MAG: hypothetical protein E6415_08605 [Intestinibacter bartlettii]|uniref:hypothetical protein n=1 Tax=Intestinibacter bartlettii TaxID=261299 RepID=UPI00290C9E56|nr:hypothetical protein [Intestinibacter bartlettii]MDU6823344.1 hypothetical protein [Intestinibacter bartlettii]